MSEKENPKVIGGIDLLKPNMDPAEVQRILEEVRKTIRDYHVGNSRGSTNISNGTVSNGTIWTISNGVPMPVPYSIDPYGLQGTRVPTGESVEIDKEPEEEEEIDFLKAIRDVARGK